MASKRRWLGRRRASDTGAEAPEVPPADIPPPPALDEPIPPPPAAPHSGPDPAGGEGEEDADAERSPLAQGRYERLAAAAGIDPRTDLSPHAQSVLDWLSRQDDAVCSGIVELLQATSLATARHVENAGG